jgi:predicted permease
VEGWTPQPGQELQVDQRGATTDYFRTMRIPVLQGRVFTEADLPSTAERVAVIDQKFADRFWPGGNAVGRRVWFDPARTIRIVGVVGTVKQYGLDIDGRLVVYLPNSGGGYHVARTSADPASVSRDLVRKVHDIDPSITAFDIQAMSDRMSSSMARQRFSTLMLGAFALFALVLAVVGLYGVMSHLVAQGSHDIGVRMALGAERRSILLMILRQGAELTVTGSALGLIGAVALTRVMASLLFGVSTTDLVTFAAVSLVMIATSMVASYVPALRATRVDPVVALRDE